MEDCEKFECDGKNKCPDFYCIPWGYTCDGKSDCPFGDDEQVNCTEYRTCDGMYKCKNTVQCLAVDDVCDGFIDCHEEDDEALCELHDMSCPSGCLCHMLAIFCLNIDQFISYQKKSGRGPARPSFFWYDNDSGH